MSPLPPLVAAVVFDIFLSLTTTIFISSTTALTGFEAELTKPGDDVTLYCEPDIAGDLSLTWMRHEADVKNGTKYFLDPKNTTLTVHAVGEEDVGEYVCKDQNGQQEKVQLKSKPVVSPLVKPDNLKEGGTLNLTCHVWGWPTPRCTWLKMYKVLSTADSGVSISNVLRPITNVNIENGQLVITDMKRSDQMNYTCSAVNDVASTNATAYIRVKDPLAAVWPAIGIIIVVILTIIVIIVVERKRRRDEAKMHPQ